MDWQIITTIALPSVAALASYYGSHLALKVHFEYLRRDVEQLNIKITDLVKEKNEAHEKIHERIDRLQDKHA